MSEVSEVYWLVARQVCTDAELEVIELRDRRHLSDRRIAMVLGISRWAVRDRLDNADRKIASVLGDGSEPTAA